MAVRARWLILLAALAALASGGASGADKGTIAIIVSSEWTELHSVSLKDLRWIYLGKRLTLEGVRVDPLVFGHDLDLQEALRARVIGKSRTWLEDYWLQQTLAGDRRPPRVIPDLDELIHAVAQNVGAIACVDAADVGGGATAGVRVVPVVHAGKPLLPSDPGYPLTAR